MRDWDLPSWGPLDASLHGFPRLSVEEEGQFKVPHLKYLLSEEILCNPRLSNLIGGKFRAFYLVLFVTSSTFLCFN